MFWDQGVSARETPAAFWGAPQSGQHDHRTWRGCAKLLGAWGETPSELGDPGPLVETWGSQWGLEEFLRFGEIDV